MRAIGPLLFILVWSFVRLSQAADSYSRRSESDRRSKRMRRRSAMDSSSKSRRSSKGSSSSSKASKTKSSKSKGSKGMSMRKRKKMGKRKSTRKEGKGGRSRSRDERSPISRSSSDESSAKQPSPPLAPSKPSAPTAIGMVMVKSLNSFDDTYSTLIETLTNAPVNVIREIDHSAAAAGVDLDLLPNRLVIFGNPNLGSPIMTENQLAGLDLPQKMLVWEDADGRVFVGYNPPDYLVARYKDVDGAEQQLETIENALPNIASAATGVDPQDFDNVPRRREFAAIKRSNGLQTQTSNDDFDTTWDRLVAAIDASPANYFVVDHGANAPEGSSLGPTRLVIFGNPRLGTPLMQSSATAGIDLPLKILVTEDDNGTVEVTTNDIDYLVRRHSIDADIPQIEAAKTAIANFVSVAVGG